jgi:hypothetical protein
MQTQPDSDFWQRTRTHFSIRSDPAWDLSQPRNCYDVSESVLPAGICTDKAFNRGWSRRAEWPLWRCFAIRTNPDVRHTRALRRPSSRALGLITNTASSSMAAERV